MQYNSLIFENNEVGFRLSPIPSMAAIAKVLSAIIQHFSDFSWKINLIGDKMLYVFVNLHYRRTNLNVYEIKIISNMLKHK